MANPLVSIIIPAYRQAQFLGQAIESALAQVYSPIEVIVINDGSDDDTETVARRFGDKIIYHWQPNRGVSAARNAAVALATGKYIYCLDADDLLAPEAIGWLVEAADCREDRLCVMGVRCFERDEAIEQGKELRPPCDRPLGVELLRTNLGPSIMFLCSRAMLVAAGGFDSTVVTCEDWDLWQRLVFKGAEVIPVSRVGAYYRQHPESASRNLLRMTKFQVRIRRRTLRRIANDPERVAAIGGDPHVILSEVKETLARELFDTGYELREQGQYLAALRHYCECIRTGGANGLAINGILKLAPHWVLRQIRGPRLNNPICP